jgi:hypothetical protein
MPSRKKLSGCIWVLGCVWLKELGGIVAQYGVVLFSGLNGARFADQFPKRRVMVSTMMIGGWVDPRWEQPSGRDAIESTQHIQNEERDEKMLDAATFICWINKDH